jgi:hypothetical protein
VAVVAKLTQLPSIRVILTTTNIKNAGLRLIVPDVWHPFFAAIGMAVRLADFARSVAGISSLRLTNEQLPSTPNLSPEVAVPPMVDVLPQAMSFANIEFLKLR